VKRSRDTLRLQERARAAFTLIELIVVMLIIVILLAISAAAVLRYTTTQQGYNTQSLLRKLQARLDTQTRLVSQRAMQEPIGTGCTGTGSTTGSAAVQAVQNAIFHIANGNPDRARVIWVKLRLRQAFPNSFLEALYPDNGYFANIAAGVSLPPLPTYQKYLNSAGITQSGGVLSGGIPAPNAYYESSVCLLLALQQGQNGGGMSAEDIGPSFLKSYPLNGSNVQMIIDGWGTPVAFCRSPWNCYAINASGAPPGTGAQMGTYNQSSVNASANLPNDPSDARGLLCDYSWTGGLVSVGGGVGGVTNTADPTISTSSAHGLSVGQTVVISGVLGATGANGTWTVESVPTATTFKISAVAPGAYASGGTVSGPSPPSDSSPPTGYTSYVGEFTGLLGYIPPSWTAAPASSGNPMSFILTPVIVSAGPDLTMALDPTFGLLATTGSESSAYDNIYSTQLQ